MCLENAKLLAGRGVTAAGARGADALKIAEEATKVGLDALASKDLTAAQNGTKKLSGILDDALKALE